MEPNLVLVGQRWIRHDLWRTATMSGISPSTSGYSAAQARVIEVGGLVGGVDVDAGGRGAFSAGS
ncbi:MAG: hypothetical protein WBG41_02300 [Acidimicrobiales bacterium]